MRFDFPYNFQVEKAKDVNSPQLLAVFHFVEADAYLSDREVTFDGNYYQPLIESWGSLENSADPESFNTLGVKQITLNIWNGGDGSATGANSFAQYLQSEDMEDVEVDIYLWFTNTGVSDAVLIDTFVIQDPIEAEEASTLINLDLVTRDYLYYQSTVGNVVTTDDWQDAKPEDIGKGIDIIVGGPIRVPTLCVKKARSFTISGTILKNSTTINTNESLDELGLNSAGTVKIGSEKIFYYDRGEYVIYVNWRGYEGTTADGHDDGAKATVVEDSYYLVGDPPVTAITDVEVEGVAADTDSYTVDLENGLVIFPEPPSYTGYSTSSQDDSVSFDTLGNSNTSYQGHYAYDEDSLATSALISENYPVLQVYRSTDVEELGQLVRIFLFVRHWASNYYSSDYVQVEVSGLGVVGTLSRPDSDDQIVLEADVVIDHGHEHSDDDEHDHDSTDAEYYNEVGLHEHDISTSNVVTATLNSPSLPYTKYTYSISGSADVDFEWSWSSPGGDIVSKTLTLEASITGGSLGLIRDGIVIKTWGIGVVNETISLSVSPGNVYFRFYEGNVINGYITITNAELNVEYSSDATGSSRSSVESNLSEGLIVDPATGTNSTDDVQDLTGASEIIDFYTTESPTQAIDEYFDLTDYIDGSVDVSFFKDRTVTLTYVGSEDNVRVLIPLARFEVEYRKEQSTFSDNVTANVTSSISSNPAEVLYYFLTEKGGVPGELVDSSNFENAKWLTYKAGYSFHGIISASSTVKEVVKKLNLQARMFQNWAFGEIKFLFNQDRGDRSTLRDLGPDDLQLRSFSFSRKKRVDIINSVNCLYDKDWTADSDPYLSTFSARSDDSILIHGELSDDSRWEFDLVTDDEMAASLAWYYLSKLAVPTAFFRFNTYLEHMDIERGDLLTVTTTGFSNIRKVIFDVIAKNYNFYSPKNNQISHVNIVGEVYPYSVISLSVNDQVIIVDTTTIERQTSSDQDESMFMIDRTFFEYGLNLKSDIIAVSESISFVWDASININENLAVSELISFEIRIFVEDSLNVSESSAVFSSFGYGSGGYGEWGYGGLVTFGADEEDWLYAGEELSFAETTEMSEDVTVDEEILFSDGYGGPSIGDGYGVTPYGA